MKNKSGFTLVELIVVIAILGILTVIAVFNYLNVQRQARDEQRATDAIVVSESLEKYFAENGEYPSVAQMTNTNGNTVKQLLGLTGLDSLVAPFATGTTNSWKSGTSNTADTLTFTYSGNLDTSASCNSNTGATDRCNDFKIQYYNEEEGRLVTITSRNTSVAVNVTQREGVVAPDGPTVNVTLVGSNATATSSTATCQIGATARYAFQNRTNDGTWSGWSAWSTGTTSSVAAAQGSKYGFRAKAQCQVGTVVSGDSTISAEDTYIRPISTPSTPDVYTTGSFRPNYHGGICIDAAGGSSAPGTLIQIYACNGSAAQDWSRDSGDGTFRLASARTTCIQYMGKGVQLRLQTCDGGTDQQWNSDASGRFVSVSSGYCIDGSNWATANGSPIGAWDCTNATAQIWNPSDSQSAWTWPATSCPAGTTVEYRVNHQTTALADSGWVSAGTTPRVVRTTVNQGYTYITQAQARCYTSYVTSAWSGTGSSGLVKAVLRPGDATGWAFAPWSGRNGWGWSWDSPACGAGTNRTYIEESWTGVTNNAGGSVLYWLAPRTPNGPGNVWWYTADSTGGAAYVWYAPASNGRGDTFVSYPSGNLPYGVNVIARTQYRCVNPVTGRSATGDWTQSVTNYT
jgi:prepilin-type N-terminal cleavage/methylation domain-containing protein